MLASYILHQNTYSEIVSDCNPFFLIKNIVYPDIWMGLLAHALHAALQYLFLYQFNWGLE